MVHRKELIKGIKGDGRGEEEVGEYFCFGEDSSVRRWGRKRIGGSGSGV